MSGSTGSELLAWLRRNTGTWFGGTQGLNQLGYNTSGENSSNFPTPPVPETGAVSSPGDTPYDPTVAAPSDWGAGAQNYGDTSSAVGGGSVASALGALSKLSGSSGDSSSASSRIQNAPLVQSQAMPGGSGLSGLNALINAMNQRRSQFFIGGGGGSGESRGLLG